MAKAILTFEDIPGSDDGRTSSVNSTLTFVPAAEKGEPVTLAQHLAMKCLHHAHSEALELDAE